MGIIMSSYPFEDVAQGPPAYPVQCDGSWICEHRNPLIANMVLWRRVAGTSAVENFQKDSGGSRIAFSRGKVAFVAFNRDDTLPWTATLQTGLPPGKYCDVIKNDDVKSCQTILVK